MRAAEPADNAGRERGPGGGEAAVQVAEGRARNSTSRGSGGDVGRKSNRSLDVGGEEEEGVIDDVAGGEAQRRRQPLETGLSSPAAAAAQDGPPFAPGSSGERREPTQDRSSSSGRSSSSSSNGSGSGSSSSSSSSSSAVGARPTLSDGKVGAKLFPEHGGDPGFAAASTAALAPAWCGGDNSSLDDLVYWTKGLDYDAAVKGL